MIINIVKNITLIITIILLTYHTSFCLSTHDKKRIGEQIWLNETNKREEYLVYWSLNESFPSLGIGHFIWYPKGHKSPYTQQFPLLIEHFKKNGIVLPERLKNNYNEGAPWQSREEFLQDEQRRTELIKLLLSTIDLQISFIINQFEAQLPLLIQAAPKEQQEKLNAYVTLMFLSTLGIYALIDYLHFKGNGLNPQEEVNGQRWGLLQAMLNLPDNLTQDNITKAFAISTAEILLRLIKNSTPTYSRITFLPGWMKRVHSYANDKLFSETTGY